MGNFGCLVSMDILIMAMKSSTAVTIATACQHQLIQLIVGDIYARITAPGVQHHSQRVKVSIQI